MREVEGAIHQITWVLEQVSSCLQELPDELSTWRPVTPDGNDALTIASHVLGATSSFVLGLVFGRPVGRDRFAEFHPSHADRDVLMAELTALRETLVAAGDQPVVLDEAIQVPDGWVGPAAEGTRRDALLEALRHASIHLGELRLVRDLALAR